VQSTSTAALCPGPRQTAYVAPKRETLGGLLPSPTTSSVPTLPECKNGKRRFERCRRLRAFRGDAEGAGLRCAGPAGGLRSLRKSSCEGAVFVWLREEDRRLYVVPCVHTWTDPHTNTTAMADECLSGPRDESIYKEPRPPSTTHRFLSGIPKDAGITSSLPRSSRDQCSGLNDARDPCTLLLKPVARRPLAL
jgi:hypothetical protein